jgi:hypothetical protein
MDTQTGTAPTEHRLSTDQATTERGADMAQWPNRELDQRTADAVALMTLYIRATDLDDEGAARLLEEVIQGPDGARQTVGGFESLCGALLVLLELETGASPEASLQRVGSMVANAVRLPT